MKSCRASLLLVLAASGLAGCGGSPDVEGQATASATPSVDRADVPPPRMPAVDKLTSSSVKPTATEPTTAKASPAPMYVLVVFKDRVVHQDLDELAPVRGAGYETLRAFVYVRGKPRKSSPIAGVHAYCATPIRCEYRPPRKTGVAEKYTISLDSDSVAKLSAADDMVAITARQLEVAKPVTVSVTLMVEGMQPVTKRIVYAKLNG